jgi:hypothetical protein
VLAAGLSPRAVLRTTGLAVTVTALGSLVGCTGTPAADMESAVEEQRELLIFVFDRSTSIPNHSLTLSAQLANQRLDELTHGDQISAMQLLQLSLAEPPRRWSQSVPLREFENQKIASDSVSRARFLMDAKAYLRVFSDTAGREDINGTDILSTLHDVSEELRAYPNYRATLYLFSDMLQSNRQIDFEGLRKMPPPDLVEEYASKGMLPDLTGLCVVALGARVDTEASQRVKQFWFDYFRATGAQLMDHNYMLRPVRIPVNPCPVRQAAG